MEKTTFDLIKLSALGINLVVDASTKTTFDLIKLASLSAINGGQLKLVNCNHVSTQDLIKIVAAYPKNITLDFTDFKSLKE